MLITNRDFEILKFINEFGFCEMPQLEKKFNLRKPRNYQLIGRLIKAGFIIHERIFHGIHGVYYLSKTGADCTDLPPLKNIPKDNYEHQLKIIDVYFKLMTQFPGATWISERQIRRQKSFYSVGKRIKHLADGVLALPDGSQIAIEVELTMKNKERLKEIILSYALHNNIKEVWYFCSAEIVNKVRSLAGDWDYIKIYELG